MARYRDPYKPTSYAYEPQATIRAREVSAVTALNDRVAPAIASGDPLELQAALQMARDARQPTTRQVEAQAQRRTAAMREAFEQRANPKPAEEARPSFLGQLGRTFRSLVPSDVQETAGRAFALGTSAESFANLFPGDPGTKARQAVESIPGVGKPLAIGLDAALSPLSIASAGFGSSATGARAVAALGTKGLAGRALAGAIGPVVEGGFGAQVAAQGVAGVGGHYGSELASAGAERLGAPEWAQTAAGLAGGFAGGAVGIGGTVGARSAWKAATAQRAREALKAAAPEAFQVGRAAGEDLINPEYSRGGRAFPVPRAEDVRNVAQVDDYLRARIGDEQLAGLREHEKRALAGDIYQAERTARQARTVARQMRGASTESNVSRETIPALAGGAETPRASMLDSQAKRDYDALLEEAKAEVAQTGKVSEETHAKLLDAYGRTIGAATKPEQDAAREAFYRSPDQLGDGQPVPQQQIETLVGRAGKGATVRRALRQAREQRPGEPPIAQEAVPEWVAAGQRPPNVEELRARAFAGEEAPEDVLRALRRHVEEQPSTHEIPDDAPGPWRVQTDDGQTIEAATRGELRQAVEEHLYQGGSPVKGRRADIVLGVSGAGKSRTFVDPIKEQFGSIVIDSDDGKKLLPEFANGNGAGAVHEESSNIIENLVARAAINGDNIVLPMVGKTAAKVQGIIEDLAAQGYDVHLRYMDLPAEEGARRVWTRYLQGNQGFVDPAYVRAQGDLPRRSYEALKAHPGVTDYAAYSNDVPHGTPPRFIEEGSLRSGGSDGIGDRTGNPAGAGADGAPPARGAAPGPAATGDALDRVVARQAGDELPEATRTPIPQDRMARLREQAQQRFREAQARGEELPRPPQGGASGETPEQPFMLRKPERPAPQVDPDAVAASQPVRVGESGEVPLSAIRTRPELFQARDVAEGASFDERRVQSIMGNYSRDRLDPLSVALDPEGGYVVLAGHHRFEALRRLGEETAPIRVVDADLSTRAGMAKAQSEAILSNFSQAEQNVRERVRAFSTLADQGMSVDEIGAQARMSAEKVQRTIDVGHAGRQIVDRVTANPALEGVAAEVGRFRRLNGASEEDALGTFDALVRRGKGETLPSAPAVRRMLDRLAPAFENRQLPGFEGNGFSGDSTPLYTAVREGARLQDELQAAQRRVSREVAAVKSLGGRAGADVSALEAAGQTELASIQQRLGSLEAEVLARVRTQAEQAPRTQGQATLGEVAPAPVQQSGPDLFAASGMEPPRQGPPRRPTAQLPESDGYVNEPRLPGMETPRLEARPDLGDAPNASDYGHQAPLFQEPPLTGVQRAAALARQMREQPGATAADLLNAPRTLMSSGDISYTLRQNAMLAPSHPRAFVQSVRDQLAAWRSPEAAQAVQDRIVGHPRYPWLRKMGVEVLESAGHEDEAFLSRAVGDLPLVRQSARAATAASNSMRTGAAYDWLAGFTDAELAAMPEARLRAMGGFFNAATGRGQLPEYLENHAKTLSAVFFSPRNFIGKVQTNLAVFSRDAAVRKEAAKSLAAFYGTGAGILLLAHLGGLKVGLTPTSSDFGKIETPGGVRIDIWGGNQQLFRFVANMVTGKTTSARTGQSYDQGRGETVFNFLKSKLAPVPSTALAAARGETPDGQQLRFSAPKLGEQAIRLVTPLFIQDLVDATMAAGPAEGALAGGLSALGVGAQSYERGPADDLAREAFGKPYASLTGPERGELIAAHPELTPKLLEEAGQAGGKGGQAAQFRQQAYSQQLAADAQFQEGKITRQQWQQQRSDRTLKLRGALEATYGPAEQITEAQAQADPLKRYLRAIAQATDPETGQVDTGAVERERAGWGPDVNAAVDRSLGTSDTPLVRAYRQAANSYYDLPRYAGYDAAQARQIDDLWTRARARAASTDELAMNRALRQVVAERPELDRKIVTGVRRRIAGSLPKAPDRKRATSRDALTAYFFGTPTPRQLAQAKQQLQQQGNEDAA